MPPSKKRKLSARRRRAAALKGWITRRRREAAEFKRRSKAAKNGWRRRKAREEIERRAKALPGAKKGRLREWVVNFSYEGKNPRTIDFTVIARSDQDAITWVYRRISEGRDSNGYDLVWMERVPWDEVSATEIAKDEKDRLDAKEIKALGESWVEKH